MYSERDHKTKVERMLRADSFSNWLGIRLVSIAQGACSLSMAVTDQMANGFGIAHGGIVYSLADSAMAFASNQGSDVFVSITSSINYSDRCEIGDDLSADAIEVASSGRTATYDVVVKRNADTIVAVFRGMVYRTRLAGDQ